MIKVWRRCHSRRSCLLTPNMWRVQEREVRMLHTVTWSVPTLPSVARWSSEQSWSSSCRLMGVDSSARFAAMAEVVFDVGFHGVAESGLVGMLDSTHIGVATAEKDVVKDRLFGSRFSLAIGCAKALYKNA
jgi:hypothetical protein